MTSALAAPSFEAPAPAVSALGRVGAFVEHYCQALPGTQGMPADRAHAVYERSLSEMMRADA